MRHILTIVGARPQFIKSAPVSLALQAAGIQETVVHTGQHYDANMSATFFEQLNLPLPAYNLEIGSGSHAYQTGEGLKRLEAVLVQEQPDAVLVYGDTNSTLAGGLAAAKLHIPVAHVEAGLRSYNRRMPEEINRVLTDHLSRWLFAPTQVGVNNLEKEGITQGVYLVGDVMLDALRLFMETAEAYFSGTLETYQLPPKAYLLLTLHRAETTAEPEKVSAILKALDTLGIPILFPTHPRIKPLTQALGPFRYIQCVEPLSYFEMLLVEKYAKAIVTDSGGVQKEAAFLEVPCITLREETEWLKTVSSGWNQLAGLSLERLLNALEHLQYPEPIHALYGDGDARTKIVQILTDTSVSLPQALTH